ncbi:hypothetical protein CU098_003042 [Rhizopus stolonifer]|uniref:Uncharacterized protein n=1 Tax=Rhizopus stolonifer TaxID=4846 RepID=A0A367IPK7_RHIST|nr:hypothetical protein CU098_003042 [Rhizopus stolonifer]
MDKILSLLKDQDIKTPSEPQTTTLPVGLDLSKISQNVIDQVRNEYLATKKNQEIKNATSITPEVLSAISRLVKETNLIDTLKQCKSRQDKKERELYAHRESIRERYRKQKDGVLAKQLIGVQKVDKELKQIENEMSKELHRMDLQIIKDMDTEVKHLQQAFSKLDVPFFKVTNDPQDIKLQQKVLFILQDMI